MGITYISGLFSLLGLVFIVVLYMLRPKKELVEIPSTYLWKQISDELTNAKKIEKVRKTLLFFLDVLIAVLITVFLLGVFFQGENASLDTVIIIDAGFSMNSTDVAPSRLEKAKELASQYVDRLDDGVEITLVRVGKEAKELYSKETDKNSIKAAISAIDKSYALTSLEEIFSYVNAINNDKVRVVYFGDRELPVDEVVNVAVNNDNLRMLNFKVKKSSDSANAAAVIENEYSEDINVEVSIYQDDLYSGTESVLIKAGEVGNVLFSSLDKNARVYKAVIENKDINPYDNSYYDVGSSADIKKVALISEGNYFVEKFLSLRDDVELSKAKPSEYVKLSGYDLYIFDSFVPEVTVTDGSVLMLDPPDTGEYKKLGDIVNPDYKVEDHIVNRFIEKKRASIARSKVYEKKPDYEPIYSVKEGLLAYSTKDGFREKIVFGFDFRYTDMPLDSSFPILMNNVVSYLMQNRVTDKNRYSSEDVVEIRVPVDAKRATVVKPNEVESDISVEKDVVYYLDTMAIGAYKIALHSGSDDSDYVTSYHFVVNPPNLTSGGGNEVEGVADGSSEVDTYTMNDYIGMAILLLLLIELFVRHKKRK